MRTITDLIYAEMADEPLAIDLFLPGEAASPPPMVLWMNGGGFMEVSKDDPPVLWLVDAGFALASITYRVTPRWTFPAAVHDAKSAVRWLRAHADDYGYTADRIGVGGDSAGGYLAVMLGATGDRGDLEGDGPHPDQSSRVQAVFDSCGPTDFARMSDFSGDFDHDAPESPESQFIGGAVPDSPDLVWRANPITYVTAAAAPTLILHGAADRIVPVNQSELLAAALYTAGVAVTFLPMPGMGHSIVSTPVDVQAEVRQAVIEFFDRHLRGA